MSEDLDAIRRAQALANFYNQIQIVTIHGRVMTQESYDKLKVKPEVLEIVHPVQSEP
jgi:hypothetical protein